MQATDNTQNCLSRAAYIARQHGTQRGGWAVSHDSDHAAILKGIEDGDPLVLDSIGEPGWLSGEWADDPTPHSMLRLVGWDEEEDTEASQEICQVYEEAASEAYWAEIERSCRYYLQAATEKAWRRSLQG